MSAAPLKIDLFSVGFGDRGQRFAVRFEGQVLLESSAHPEFDACRELTARGLSGPLEVWWAGATYPAIRLDIAVAAQLTSRECDRDGPAVIRWRPFSETLREAPQASAQTAVLVLA